MIAVLKKHREAQVRWHDHLGIGDADSYVFDRRGGQRVKLIDKAQPNAPQACAHMWDPAGIDLFTICKSLGHSSTSVTSKIYVHQLSKTERAATSAFETYISGVR